MDDTWRQATQVETASRADDRDLQLEAASLRSSNEDVQGLSGLAAGPGWHPFFLNFKPEAQPQTQLKPASTPTHSAQAFPPDKKSTHE